jgi:hypothetical protein
MIENLGSLFPRQMQAGQAGVVIARAGVGKTSFLVRLALEALQDRGQMVHIALGQTLERVHHHYSQLYADSSPEPDRGIRDEHFAELARGRAVQILSERSFDDTRLKSILDTFRLHLDIKPALVVVDGADWHPDRTDPGWLNSLKQVAREAGARLWLSLLSPSEPSRVADEIDLAVWLEQDSGGVKLRLLKTWDQPPNGDWIQLTTRNGKAPRKLDPADCTLLSGAADGAEEAFGACAEQAGVCERNLSFAGRKVTRHRGVVLLSEDELKQGEVSTAYLNAHMHRRYRQDDEFRKILQSIWHQVNPALEVFAVGKIQKDGTVKGGTGWAVELAKHLAKPVNVYDQTRNQWFHYRQGEWVEVDPPVIQRTVFTGTGTRKLSAEGRQAIADLFERSFS